MSGQLGAVRVALYQTSSTDAAQLRVETSDDNSDKYRFFSNVTDKVALRQSDYRGLLLLPIVEGVTTCGDMLSALEARLTQYCVLHIRSDAVDADQHTLLRRIVPTMAADAALYDEGVRPCVCPHAALVQPTTQRQSALPSYNVESGVLERASSPLVRLRPQIRIRSLTLCTSRADNTEASPTTDALTPITPAGLLARHVCPGEFYCCVFALTLRPAGVDLAAGDFTPSADIPSMPSGDTPALTSCVCVKSGERVMRLVARAGERVATGLLQRLRERRQLRVTRLVDDRTGACVLPCEDMTTVAQLAPMLHVDTTATTPAAARDTTAQTLRRAPRMHTTTTTGRSGGVCQGRQRGGPRRVAGDTVKRSILSQHEVRDTGHGTEVRYYGAYEHLNHAVSYVAGTLISMPDLGSSDKMSYGSVRGSSRACATSTNADDDELISVDVDDDDEDNIENGTPASRVRGNYIASLSSVGLDQPASISTTGRSGSSSRISLVGAVSSSRRLTSSSASKIELTAGDMNVTELATVSPYLSSYDVRGPCFTYSLYRAASQRAACTSDCDEAALNVEALVGSAHCRGSKRGRNPAATSVPSSSPSPSHIALDVGAYDGRDARPAPSVIRTACTPQACTPRAVSTQVDGVTDYETRLSPRMVVTQQTLPDYIVDSSISRDEDDEEAAADDDDDGDGDDVLCS